MNTAPAHAPAGAHPPVALVTGASRGIGRAAAIELARAGFDIAGWYRSDELANAHTSELVQREGRQYTSTRLDVADEDAVRAALRALRNESTGQLRTVVAAAGITDDGMAATMSSAKFRRVVETNLYGTFYLCRDVLRCMRKTGGSVVLLSSTSGLRGQAGQANYSASKGAINALTQALAKEGAGYGIRVNAVAPGFTNTDMLHGMDVSTRKHLVAQIPLGRIGDPEEIARTVRFLATDDSSYITGQIIAADGGITA